MATIVEYLQDLVDDEVCDCETLAGLLEAVVACVDKASMREDASVELEAAGWWLNRHGATKLRALAAECRAWDSTGARSDGLRAERQQADAEWRAEQRWQRSFSSGPV